MTHVSLFSGIGGLDLAAEACGFTTVLMCERDPKCRLVLARHWPEVPIVEDVRELTGSIVRDACGGRPTLLSGGFPCQPFSCAGRRRGTDDDRHLWPEMRRVVRESRPRWVLGENVRGLLSIGNGTAFGAVLADLADLGYRVGWACFGADEAAGASHRRDRVFIVGYLADGDERGRRAVEDDKGEVATDRRCLMAHGDGARPQGAEPEPEGRGAGPAELGPGMAFAGHGGGRQLGADSQGRDGEAGRSVGAGQAPRPGPELADPERGRVGWGEQPVTSPQGGEANESRDRANAPNEPGHRSPELADPGHCVRGPEHGEQLEERSTGAREQGDCVADHDSTVRFTDDGLSNSGADWRHHDGRDGRGFPPGPGDLDGWRRVALSDPGLLPALSTEAEAELQVRPVVDGVSRRVALKMLGNAVVPAQVLPILEWIAAWEATT